MLQRRLCFAFGAPYGCPIGRHQQTRGGGHGLARHSQRHAERAARPAATPNAKGGMSPITMAILALLAYKAMKRMTGGAGAVGARTAAGGRHDLDRASLPRRRRRRPRRYPRRRARRGQCRQRRGPQPQGRRRRRRRRPGRSAEGRRSAACSPAAPRAASLGGGLNDLLKQFQEGGHGDVADSWVGKGPEQGDRAETISPARSAWTTSTRWRSRPGCRATTCCPGCAMNCPAPSTSSRLTAACRPRRKPRAGCDALHGGRASERVNTSVLILRRPALARAVSKDGHGLGRADPFFPARCPRMSRASAKADAAHPGYGFCSATKANAFFSGS